MQVMETKGLELACASDRMVVKVTRRIGRSLTLFWKGLIGVVLFFGLIVAMVKWMPSHSPGDNISPDVLLGLYTATAIPCILLSLFKIQQDSRREQEGYVFDRAANCLTCGTKPVGSLDQIVAVHTIVDKDQPVYVKGILIELSTGKKIPVAPYVPLGGHYRAQEATEIARFLDVKIVTEARDYSTA